MKLIWDGWKGCDAELNNKEDCDVPNMVKGCQKSCGQCPSTPPPKDVPHKCEPQIEDPEKFDAEDMNCDWDTEKLSKDGWCMCLPIKDCQKRTHDQVIREMNVRV